MAQDDNLDNDFEEGVTEEFSEESPSMGSQKPVKKKLGGGFMLVVILLLLGGGGIVAAPMLGVNLPFSIPGLAPAAAPPVVAEVPQATVPTGAVADPNTQVQPVQIASGSEAEVPAVNGTPQNTPALQQMLPEDNMPPAIDGVATAVSDPIITAPGGVGIQPPEAPSPQIIGDPLADVTTPTAPLEIASPSPAALPSQDPLALAPETTAEAAPATDSLQQDPLQDTAALPVEPAAAQPVVETADPLAAAPVEILQQVPMQAQNTEIPVATQQGVNGEEVVKLESRISALEGGLSDLQQHAASKQDIAELKALIIGLEDKMAASKAEIKQSDAVKNARREVENYRHGIMPEAVKVERAPVERVSVARKAVSKKEPVVRTKPSGWVLKSAKPGMAWVAEKGSSELKTVSVGDSLSGVGKVTAISKDSTGHWVVTGTRGFVRQ